MKFFVTVVLLAIAISSIDCLLAIKFNQFSLQAVNKIEVHQCVQEPCELKKGKKMTMKITFEESYIPHQHGSSNPIDATIFAYAPNYHQMSQYQLARTTIKCKEPLIGHKYCSTEFDLYLPLDNETPGARRVMLHIDIGRRKEATRLSGDVEIQLYFNR